MGKERLKYLDCGKGILIILVVIGHIFSGSIIRNWVYGFHVQAFFVLSGISSNYSNTYKSDFKVFVKKKCKRIIYLMIVFELAGVIGHVIRFGFRQRIKGIVFDSVALYFNNVINWYLFAYLFASILLYLTIGIDKKYLFSIGIIAFTSAILLPDNHLGEVFSWVLIGYIGMLIGKYNEKVLIDASNKFIITLIPLWITIIAAAFNGSVSIYDHDFGNPIWFLISSIAGSVLVIGVSKKIETHKVSILFGEIGAYSLYIMGFHLPLNNVLVRICGGFSESFMYPYVAVPVIILVIVAIGRLITRAFLIRHTV